jgi:HAD superfamily hydrolase (TIGR01509 family)
MVQNQKNSFAVIFDMDGVIVDSNPYHKKALQQFCESHGYHLTDNEIRQKIFGRTNRDWLTSLFGETLTENEFLQMENEKEQLFRQIFEPYIQPIQGLLDFLKNLEKEGITRAVATSAPPDNVSFTLEKTGTANFFKTIIDGSMVQHSKPDPEIYLKAIRTIGFAPHRSIVFEDSLSGIASAQAAGCPVIGITTTHSADEFDNVNMIIDDFLDLNIADLERILF